MSSIQLYLGDCLQEMNKIPDKSVDMVLCDLPYGTTPLHWDKELPMDKLWEQYHRVCKDNCAILLFGQEPFSSLVRISNLKEYKYDWYWEKEAFTNVFQVKKRPGKNVETISVFYSKQCTYNPQMTIGNPLHGRGTAYKNKQNTNNNYGAFTPNDDTRMGSTDKYPKSILTFPKPHPSVCKHPTQKPVELLEYLIRTYTNERERVLDSCMGSGSVGVACMRTNRDFIGIEKDEKFFRVAQEWIDDEKRKLW